MACIPWRRKLTTESSGGIIHKQLITFVSYTASSAGISGSVMSSSGEIHTNTPNQVDKCLWTTNAIEGAAIKLAQQTLVQLMV